MDRIEGKDLFRLHTAIAGRRRCEGGKAAAAIYDGVNAFFRHPGRRRRAAEPFE